MYIEFELKDFHFVSQPESKATFSATSTPNSVVSIIFSVKIKVLKLWILAGKQRRVILDNS